MAVVLLLVLVLPVVWLQRRHSRLVTVWGGFSTKWYGELLQNEQILSAAALSVKIAAVNACLAMVLGTLAGFAL
ncbi:unnamed protein product, partial [Cyprideis torosa]